MKKTLIVAAIALAVVLPVATVAHKQFAPKKVAAKTETVDSCCPSSKSAKAETAVKKDASSCPYTGATRAKTEKVEPKICPMPKSEKTCGTSKSEKPCGMSVTEGKCPVGKSAKPAVTTPAAKPAPKAAAKPAEKKVESAVCPVMKAEIPDVSKASGHSVYKGKTYYFCCAGCKPLFDKNPEKYVGG